MSIRDAIEALTTAHADAVRLIEEIESPDAAYEQVKELLTVLQQLEERTLQLRTELVGRIWEAEEMSLSVLASRIGLSKARADQLIRARRRGDESQ